MNNVTVSQDFNYTTGYATVTREIDKGLTVVLERTEYTYKGLGGSHNITYGYQVEIYKDGKPIMEANFSGLLGLSTKIDKVMDVVVEHILTRLN